MLVEPGFFCTELLSPQSAQYAEPAIADRTTATVRTAQSTDGKQGGDPATLADDLVRLAALDDAAGADAVELFEIKARALLAQADANRNLSSILAHHVIGSARRAALPRPLSAPYVRGRG